MVVLLNIQTILDTLPNIPSITLPGLKENALKVVFTEGDDCGTVYNGSEPPLPFANSELFHTNICNWRRLTAVDDRCKAVYEVIFVVGEGIFPGCGTVYNGSEPPLPFANSELFHTNICNWRRLTAVDDRCKAVYEVTFDVVDSNFTFKAGDTIGIVPQNLEEDVNAVIGHLNLESVADLPYKLSVAGSIKGCKIPPHIPVQSTLRHLLTHCVDLRSVLKKLLLLALSRFTKDEQERKVLEYLCSKEGSSAYQTHILNRNLCLLDIFHIFQSCKPPVEVLIANLPRLLPRPYSIVNTGQTESRRITICFSVLDVGHNRKGLTTGWLEKLILDKEFDFENNFRKLNIANDCDKIGSIPIYIRKNMSEFHLPENLSVPSILVGPGTGVAPFIGFLEELELAKENNPSKAFGEVWLFYGCRNPDLDFIYKTEIERFLSKGVLNRLCTAFSRMDNDKNKYVQDALIQEGESIARLINDGAYIFISGDLNNMAVQIKEAIAKCIVIHQNKTQEEADKIINEMIKAKRYCVDAWS